MKNRIGMSVLCTLGLFFATLSVQSPVAGQEKTVRTPDTGKLTGQSEVIVVGKVNTLKSEWNEDKSRIQTSVTIAVDETMKGAVEGGTLMVVVPGGEVDGVGEWYSHSVTFKADEEVVVFAAKDKVGTYRVTSGERGKFLVDKDAKTGSKMIANVGSLQEFTTRVKKSVKDQQSVKKED